MAQKNKNMNYEKLHKDSIKIARRLVDEGKISKECAKQMFPEIKESEREELRERLIQIFKSYQNPKTHINPNKWEGLKICDIIDWLEKQGEYIDNSNKEYWRGYREGKQEVLDKYAGLEKQGEKKPAKWTEKDEKLWTDAKSLAYEVEDRDLAVWLIDIKERMQQKQYWSEEDELNFIRELEGLVKRVWEIAELENDEDTIHEMSDLSFFLKTLKPQLKQGKVQPKQEWSEEDEDYLDDVLKLLNGECSNHTVGHISDWLKSLKNRFYK